MKTERIEKNVNRKDDLEKQFIARMKESTDDKELHFTRPQAKIITTELIEAIKDCIYDENKDGLLIAGFCEFEKRHYDERMGRNPKTGESVVIPEKNKAVAKLAKRIKDLA